MRFKLLTPICLILLCGCVGDQANKINQTQSPVLGTTPGRPPATGVAENSTPVDFKPLKEEILNSAQQTQANLTGLVNTNISKLAEKMTGIDAQIESLVKVTTTLNTKIDTTINTNATATAIADFKAEMKNTAELNTKLESMINSNIQLKNDIDKLSVSFQSQIKASMEATANGQVGLSNKIESVRTDNTNTAGHDVNYLPKEAVELTIGTMKSNNNTFLIIITSLFSLVTTIAGIMAFNARKREDNTNKLLMQMLPHIPDTKAREVFSRALGKNFINNPTTDIPQSGFVPPPSGKKA